MESLQACEGVKCVESRRTDGQFSTVDHTMYLTPQLPIQRRQTLGFTLVELLVVAVVLAIFAAVVTASMVDADKEPKISAAHHTAKMIQKQINQHRDTKGSWPANVDLAWFRHSQPPVNPFVPEHLNNVLSDVDAVNDPNKWHPSGKTTQSFPFWFNPQNGAFRIRVPAQSSDAETLALYNAANGVKLTALSQVRVR